MEQNNLIQSDQSYHPGHHIRVYFWIALVVASFLVSINGYLYFLGLSYFNQGFKTHQEGEQKIQELKAARQAYELTPDQIFQEVSLQFGLERNQLSSFGIFGQDKVQYGLRAGTNYAYKYNGKWYLVGDYRDIQSVRDCYEYDNVPEQHMPVCYDAAIGQNKYMYSSGESINYPHTKAILYIDTTWQTYRNEEYGFEIKYPGDYIIFTDLNLQNETIISPNSSSTKVMIAKNDRQIFCCEPFIFSVEVRNKAGDSLDVWVNKEFINSDNAYRVTKKGSEEFMGQNSYRVYTTIGIDSPHNIVAFNYVGKTFLITYDNKDIFNQVLSTFRFVENP